MADVPFALFDDYAVATRGEHPDPVPYLERAGDHAGELARMLDAFLQAPPPTRRGGRDADAGVACRRATASRTARAQGMRVNDVVGELATQLGVDVGMSGKLRRYFQRLERVARRRARRRRVFDALAMALRTSSSILRSCARAARRAGDGAPAYRTEREPTVAPALPVGDDERWDYVDELFLGRETRP